MKFFSYDPRKGSALLVVLVCVTVITVLVIYLLMMMRFERRVSNLSMNHTQAEAMADLAAATAIERLREAIDEGRQPPDPSRNYYTTWASEPGRIHIFNINQTDGKITHTSRDMFSAPPGPDDAVRDVNNIDLNEASYSGIHPITGTAPGTMKIGWVPFRTNPDQPASRDNPAVARIAYWVDDDSCKVDINTADGSAKNDPIKTQVANNHFSYGFGTPSEISLQAFPEIASLAGTGKAAAAAIADYAAATGFNTVPELARATGVPVTFAQAHPFDLTTRSLTPELTMYGEPRTYLTCGAPLVNLPLPASPAPVSPPTPSPLAAAVGPYCVMKGPTGNYYGAGGKLNPYYKYDPYIYSYPPFFQLFFEDNKSDSTVIQASGPLDFTYPAANQLPGNPSLFVPVTTSGMMNVMRKDNLEALRMSYFQRVANSIYGKTSTGQAFHWPAFSGSTTGLASPGGFAAKYSLRQIDDMTLQIFDMSNTCAFADQFLGMTVPSMVYGGILNTPPSPADPNEHTPRTVTGLGRSPKLNEIYLELSTTTYTVGVNPNNPSPLAVPALSLRYYYELYIPAGYAGAPMTPDWGYHGVGPNANKLLPGVKVTSGSVYSGLNAMDSATGVVPSYPPYQRYPSYFYPDSNGSGYWTDTLWHIQDSNDTSDLNSAGFDLTGNVRKYPQKDAYGFIQNDSNGNPILLVSDDPDQTKAQKYHPYLEQDNSAYAGSCAFYNSDTHPHSQYPLLSGDTDALTQDMSPGTYHEGRGSWNSSVMVLGKKGMSSINIKGGLCLILSSSCTDVTSNFDVAPLDGFRFGNYQSFMAASGDPTKQAVREDCQKAVIPFEVNNLSLPNIYGWVARVRDPLVNQFPKDWEIVPNASLSDSTLSNDPENHLTYCKGGAASLDADFGPHPVTTNPYNPVYDVDGDNPGFKPTGGGDPLSIWLPRQDVRYPKQSRFPSVGALNYIRTGRMPDQPVPSDLSQQHGTPWRSLNLSATSTSSQTISSVTYPDWAMLDLFTVPFLPQKPYYIGEVQAGELVTTPTPLRRLTSGGATEGKLNINNPATPYPFSQTFAGVTQTPPTRKAPLEALFYGLQSVASLADYSGDNASPQTVSAAGAATLRAAVQDYLADPTHLPDGAFMLPGQLAEVPAISAYTYNGVADNAKSRNDIMRQVAGAITTQSNTYSIWIVAQTFKKAPRNTGYGTFEAGDIVTGEVRRHYTVERFIETGKDGVPGNAKDPGPDGVVGTADDPIDADYNPALTYPLPYRYRITHVEDVKL